MSREFLINLIFLLIINAIIKPLYIFGIDRTIQNVVGEDYGVYFTLLSFTYLFQMLNDFGLQNFNARNIAMHPERLNKYMPAIIKIKVGLALAFGSLIFSVAYLIGYEGHYLYLLAWLVVIQVLTSFLMYMRSNVAGLGFYRVDSFLSVFDKIILIIICGYLLLNQATADKFRIEWFLYAQVFSLGFSILFTFYFVIPKVKLRWWGINLSLIRSILKSSYPFALVYVLMMVYTRIDAVMLERLLPDGKYEAYMYASAYRLLDAANMVSFLFVGLLLPMFSRMLGKKEAIEPLFRTSVKVMAIITACFALPILFNSTEIMELLYVDGNTYSGKILQFLFLGHIFICFGQIFGALLVAHGSISRMKSIFVIGMLANLLLNFLIIPEYKALGAAFSTFITEGLVFIGLSILTYRIFRDIWTWRLIAKIGAFGFLCGFALYTADKIMDFDWRLQYVIDIAICGVFALLLRLFPSKEMLQVLQMNQKLNEE